MPRSPTTGIYTRVSNSFSNPVVATGINPTDAANFFDDAQNALNAFLGTSTSSVVVGTGSKTLTIASPSSKTFLANTNVVAFSQADTTKYISGTVTSYNNSTGALVINSVAIGAAGTVADWAVVMASGPFAALTGDVTSVGTATTIAANAVSNAKMAAMAAKTIKLNAAAGSANATDTAVSALTDIVTPHATLDWVIIEDHVAGTIKKTNASQLTVAVGSGVTTYNSRSGVVTATGTDVPLRSYISGLTLSTAGSSATFGVAVGVATDSTNVAVMALASAYTKTTGAWALGTAAGSLDTGAIANGTWYHVYLIQRVDTGVVDVLTSLSASTPTMPTNYTLFRRIGSMLTDGSAHWVLFNQVGDEFLWTTRVSDVNAAASSATAALSTLSVPSGIKVRAQFSLRVDYSTVPNAVLLTSPDESDQAATTQVQTVTATSTATTSTSAMIMRTNTSAQIRIRSSGAGVTIYVTTYGWLDDRGRSA